jgi:hypothetical protein
VRVLFKSTLLTLFFLLLSWSSFAVLAQQDENIDEEKTVTQITSATSEPEVTNTSNRKTNAVPPKPLTLQYNEDIKHYLPASKVTPLLAGTEEYITLITENSSMNNKGVAILLPDWEQGATSPKALNFLRQQLPEQGWTTISVQPSSKPSNYPSNAITVLQQQEENKKIIDEYRRKLSVMMNAVIEKANEFPGIIMIVAQGNHSAMLVELLNQDINPPQITQPPNALVLLSSYVLSSNVLLDETNTVFAKQLAKSEYPVLDLYLKHDNPVVISKAKQRITLSKQEMKVYYRQRQLNNTAMGYYPEQELLTQINSWLKAIGW